MAQDYVDDLYSTSTVADTTLSNMEKNFAALKSAFSGASAPSNPVAGMWWLDTTNHILKVRNEANNAWLSVWDVANNKPIITNLSGDISGDMIAAAIKDPAANVAGLRTLGTGAQQAMPGNTSIIPPDNSISEAKLQSSAVSQAKLKTSQGEVSLAYSPNSTPSGNYTLPGGEYGFYPRIKLSSGTSPGNNIWHIGYGYNATSYATNIYMQADNGSGGWAGYMYANQRYVTSSGEVHWVFILRDKSTKKILSVWQAPDHPCFGNGGKPTLVPHPFPDFDSETQEIVVINPSKELVAEIEAKRYVDEDVTPDLSFIEVLLRDYEIDEEAKAEWPTVAVTVGLPVGTDLEVGKSAVPIKKKIPQPDGVIVRKLRLKK